jgi:hypothetical protein
MQRYVRYRAIRHVRRGSGACRAGTAAQLLRQTAVRVQLEVPKARGQLEQEHLVVPINHAFSDATEGEWSALSLKPSSCSCRSEYPLLFKSLI